MLWSISIYLCCGLYLSIYLCCGLYLSIYLCCGLVWSALLVIIDMYCTVHAAIQAVDVVNHEIHPWLTLYNVFLLAIGR